MINKNIHNKENIDFDLIIKMPNTGRGSCIFKTLSQFFTNKETYHVYFF